MRNWIKRPWLLRTLQAGLVIIIAATAWYFIRVYFRPSIPEPSLSAIARSQRVKILRDRLGVPHIFGKTDADTAFGLAYANAEDDFPTIQDSLAAARGRLALLRLDKIAVLNDYLVQALHIQQRVDDQYERLISTDYKEILDAYAEGINFYAHYYPDEIDSRFLPYTGRDVVAGFIHKLALFVGVGGTLEDLLSREEDLLDVGRPMQRMLAGNSGISFPGRTELMGSNSHAVGPSRSADDITRLNINSHQPYEGPVAWYEAHLVSEEGWDMIGGLFPGSPVIHHGHNKYLGWAHTVNSPDAIDVYKLSMHPDGSLQYKFDQEWKQLIVRKARIEIDTGFFDLPITYKSYESIHGPVLKLKEGFYAIRYAGMNRAGLSVEQWFRMNKAKNLDEWKKAMAMQGLPMMNTMYADQNNILYVYNHLLPIRNENYNWRNILPGDTSETLWTDYLPFEELPMVENPPSGYVMNTNSTPFQATVGEGNPNPDDFSETSGIETHMNNRAIRSHELFGTDDSISRDEFFKYKYDRKYSKKSSLFREVIIPLLKNYTPKNKNEKEALNILEKWDGNTDEASAAATLANLIYRPIFRAGLRRSIGAKALSVEKAFRGAVVFLMKNYGRIDVPLGQVQRLQRGRTDLPLGGSMDVLNAVHTEIRDGKMVGVAGDSYIMIVEFSHSGAESWARHQYGNVNRKDSIHYDDQAVPFSRRMLRKSLLKIDEIRTELESEYHPGEENQSQSTIINPITRVFHR